MYLCRTWESCWECTVVAFVAEATMFGFGKNRAWYLLQTWTFKNAKKWRSQHPPPFLLCIITVSIGIELDVCGILHTHSLMNMQSCALLIVYHRVVPPNACHKKESFKTCGYGKSACRICRYGTILLPWPEMALSIQERTNMFEELSNALDCLYTVIQGGRSELACPGCQIDWFKMVPG